LTITAHTHVARDRAHIHDVRPFVHDHAFTDAGAAQRASALTAVTAITFVTMIIELVAGYWSGSLALTADGWHMGTHAVALGGAALAYRLSQKANNHEAYAFGGWKIEVLSGYSSGLLLLAVALWLIFDSVRALIYPSPVNYADALVVAVIGLLVNLASAWLLSRGGVEHGHSHGHGGAKADTHRAHAVHEHEHEHLHADEAGHDRGHEGHDHGLGATVHGAAGAAHTHSHREEAGRDHGAANVADVAAAATSHGHAHAKSGGSAHAHDHNFNAAYLHVLADLFTSVLAVAALCGGLWFGWRFLDPAVALLGAAVIGNWSIGVLRNSAKALVDASSDADLVRRVRSAIEGDGDAQIADLHVWQVGTDAFSAIVSIVADAPLSPARYKARLRSLPELRHVTVEVNQCPETAVHAAS